MYSRRSVIPSANQAEASPIFKTVFKSFFLPKTSCLNSEGPQGLSACAAFTLSAPFMGCSPRCQGILRPSYETPVTHRGKAESPNAGQGTERAVPVPARRGAARRPALPRLTPTGRERPARRAGASRPRLAAHPRRGETA